MLLQSIKYVWISEIIFKCFILFCVVDQSIQYGSLSNSLPSSITILANSLAPNQTYQFMVTMTHCRNTSVQATGYLTVQVEDTTPELVVIG
jgi:hypothetical protein